MLPRVIAIALLALAAANARAAEPAVAFLTGDDARKEIINDAMEPYFSRLQPAEMEMKTGKAFPDGTLEELRAECRKRYQSAVVDFTPEEKTLLAAAVEKASALTTDYPLYHDLPWSFVKTDGTIEGGLPYTLGGSIFLAQRDLQMALRVAADAGAGILTHLLLHEQSHVFQRKYPKIMADLYQNLWHFEKLDPIAFDSVLIAKHVFNPDGPDVTWAYPVGNAADHTFILPMVIAEKPAAAKTWVMLRDMTMVAVPLTRKDKTFTPDRTDDGKTKTVGLSSFRDYIRQFPVGGDNYHPNEIAAEAFAIIALAQDNTPERWKPERDWFKGHMQAVPRE